jgi:AraC-like DNA-binding protein
MHIVALLSSYLLTRLVEAIGQTHVLRAVADPVELQQLLRTADTDLVVIDPTMAGDRFGDQIEAAVVHLQSVPVIIYTTVSAQAMGLVLRLAPLGVRHLVLYGIDDEPRPLRELIERVPTYPVIDMMLQELAGPLSSLTPSVRRAITLVFKSPTRARTGAEMAQLASMTRRSLYRHMASAGLQPRDVIDCALLLRAYTLLRAPGGQLKQTSVKLGFARPQTLSDLLKEWTGLPARSINQGLEPAAFVRLLSAHFLGGSNSQTESDDLLEAFVESV